MLLSNSQTHLSCVVRWKDYASRWSHRFGILTFPEALRAVEEKTYDIIDNIEPPREDIFEQQKEFQPCCLPQIHRRIKNTFALYARILISRKNVIQQQKETAFIHTILCVACYFGCASALKFFNKDSEIKNARTTPQKTVKLLSPQRYFVS